MSIRLLVLLVLVAAAAAADPWVQVLPERWRRQAATAPEAVPDPAAWDRQVPKGRDEYWYEQTLAVPAAWAGRRLVADFSRIEGDAVVFLDGRRVAERLRPGGEVDLGVVAQAPSAPVLRVFVTRAYTGISRGLDRDHLRRLSRIETPSPIGRERWGLGITGPVRLIARARPAAVTDVWMIPSWRERRLTAQVEVASERPVPGARLQVAVADADGRTVLTLEQGPVDLPAGVSTHRLSRDWQDPIPWELDRGYLYTASANLQAGGVDAPAAPVRFGFREIWTEGRAMILNGHPVRLRMGVLDLGLTRDSLGFWRAMGCNAAYQQANPTMWWRDWAESPLLSPETLEACDQAGFALYQPAPGITYLRERLLSDPEVAAQYTGEMEAWQRRWRNHPSIIAWTVGMNTFNPRDAIAPQGFGRRYQGERAGASMARVIGRACAIAKGLDPTRLAYSHADGNVGDIASGNVYLNFAPLQERMEWPMAWAADGDMPVHSAEFGPPYVANLWKGKRFLATEYLAIEQGEAAFAGEREVALRQTEAIGLSNASGHGDSRWITPALFPGWYDLLGLFARHTDRAWRTYGINGGTMYWEFDYGEPPGWEALVARKGRQAVFSRYSLATGISGALPAWVNPGVDARAAGNQAFLGWIAGHPSHTDRTHLYAAGESIRKQAALVWDGPGPARIEAAWSLRDAGGAAIAGGTVVAELAAGEIRRIPIEAIAPPVAERTRLQVVLRGTRDGIPFPEDRFGLTVFPAAPARPPVPAVALHDPAGRSTAWLQALGVRTVPWTRGGTAPGGILVVGRESIRAGEPLPWTPADLAAGLRVLVLEQQPAVWRALGFRTCPHLPRQAFFRERGLLAEGLEDDDLALWRGAPDLLPPGVDQPGDAPHAPRWTNTHAIAATALRVPRLAGAVAHLSTEFDQDYTPLLELRVGRGALWCSTLDWGRVGRDPAATRLAGNLLRTLAVPAAAPRPTAWRGGAAAREAWTRLGFDPAEGRPAAGGLLVAGPGATAEDDALARSHAGSGGTVLLWARSVADLAAFGFRAAPGELVRTAPAAHPLLAGVPASWLRWRSPLAVDLLAASGQPEGTAVLADGLAAWRDLPGGGAVAVLQADPALLAGLAGDRAASALTSRIHLEQLVARVLTGLGARPSGRVAARLSACDLGPAFEPVSAWHVLGPFPVPREDDDLMLAAAPQAEADAIAGEANPNTLFDDGTGRMLDWRRVLRADATGKVDLGAALQRDTLAVAYLTTALTSPAARTARLRLGADWRMRAWVNGVEVLRTARGLNRPGAYAVEVPLRQGENRITLKVASGGKGFAVYADLDRPRPAGGEALDEAVRGTDLYAGSPESQEFDPYEFHYW